MDLEDWASHAISESSTFLKDTQIQISLKAYVNG